jgi:hypothetical protein
MHVPERLATIIIGNKADLRSRSVVTKEVGSRDLQSWDSDSVDMETCWAAVCRAFARFYVQEGEGYAATHGMTYRELTATNKTDSRNVFDDISALCVFFHWSCSRFSEDDEFLCAVRSHACATTSHRYGTFNQDGNVGRLELCRRFRS